MNNNAINNGSFLLQMYSVMLIMRDFNNRDLMQELQNQDNNFLTKIVEQNEEILKILNERRSDDGEQR